MKPARGGRRARPGSRRTKPARPKRWRIEDGRLLAFKTLDWYGYGMDVIARAINLSVSSIYSKYGHLRTPRIHRRKGRTGGDMEAEHDRSASAEKIVLITLFRNGYTAAETSAVLGMSVRDFNRFSDHVRSYLEKVLANPSIMYGYSEGDIDRFDRSLTGDTRHDD